MFQIGAINPNVGDDRRKQLLQTLAQQFVQRQGAGVPGEPGLPMFAFNRKRTPVFGNANKVNPTLRSGRTDMTNAQSIPDSLSSLLGPGGFGHASANVMSPAAGMPVPGMGRPGALLPTSAAPAASTSAAPGAPAPMPGGVTSAPVITAPAQSGGQSPAMQAASGQAAINAYNQASAQPHPVDPLAAAASASRAPQLGLTTPSGLVPLGNGVFINPATGAISGMGPTPFGGFGGGGRMSVV